MKLPSSSCCLEHCPRLEVGKADCDVDDNDNEGDNDEAAESLAIRLHVVVTYHGELLHVTGVVPVLTL